jgi:hypothetical protein
LSFAAPQPITIQPGRTDDHVRAFAASVPWQIWRSLYDPASTLLPLHLELLLLPLTFDAEVRQRVKSRAHSDDQSTVLKYVPDGEPEYTDETVNVNCVLRWRLRRNAPNESDLLVDFGNGWIFESGRWTGRADVRQKVLSALRANVARKRC